MLFDVTSVTRKAFFVNLNAVGLIKVTNATQMYFKKLNKCKRAG